MRSIYASALTCVVLIIGCSKSNSVDQSTTAGGGELGSECANAADCGPASACVLGFCRQGCTNDSECPRGSLCVGAAAPLGCTFESENSCATDDDCPQGLTCTIDGRCRNGCAVDDDCPRNEHRCLGGACVSGDDSDSRWDHCEETLFHPSPKGEFLEVACAWTLEFGSGGDYCPEGGCQAGGIYACNATEPGWALAEQCEYGCRYVPETVSYVCNSELPVAKPDGCTGTCETCFECMVQAGIVNESSGGAACLEDDDCVNCLFFPDQCTCEEPEETCDDRPAVDMAVNLATEACLRGCDQACSDYCD